MISIELELEFNINGSASKSIWHRHKNIWFGLWKTRIDDSTKSKQEWKILEATTNHAK